MVQLSRHLVGRGLEDMVSTSRVMMIGLPMMLQLAIMACNTAAQMSACTCAAAARATD